VIEQRRSEDKGAMCWLAARLSQMWDFIDKRDIDKHIVAAIIILYGTAKLTAWGIRFAERWLEAGHAIPGSEVALVVGAVLAPYMMVASVVAGFYFRR
jgi:hypothetical protein